MVNASELQYQNNQPLKFTLLKKNKQLKKGVLESYLGASAHIVMIAKETKDFLHVHSMGNKQYPIYAETIFPESGWYKIWVQYKVEGKLRTSTFAVNVTNKGASVNKVDHSAH